MKLSEIAAKLRKLALDNPGETQSMTLGQGAVCNLRVELLDQTTAEFHLQIKRDGKLPADGTPAFKAWLRELSTFRKPDYFRVPDTVQAAMTAGARSYAAAFVWSEQVELPIGGVSTSSAVPNKVTPIPQNEAELAAWAKGLGDGVRLKGQP